MDPRFEEWGYGQLFETMEFSDDCRALGFEMDCGQAFTEAFPGCFRDPVATERAIAGCNDVDLLGSALHSGWRYYNHWNAFGASSPMSAPGSGCCYGVSQSLLLEFVFYERSRR